MVEADSSGYAIRGVLSQYDTKQRLRPVAFFSKKLSPEESNYPIHDKELLAIILCLQQWDAELRSVKEFTVLSDHQSLERFLTKQQLSERQMRWALTLSRYNFVIKHRPGKTAILPDALSRREQDLPLDADDDRIKARHQQLLTHSSDGSLRLNKIEIRGSEL